MAKLGWAELSWWRRLPLKCLPMDEMGVPPTPRETFLVGRRSRLPLFRSRLTSHRSTELPIAYGTPKSKICPTAGCVALSLGLFSCAIQIRAIPRNKMVVCATRTYRWMDELVVAVIGLLHGGVKECGMAGRGTPRIVTPSPAYWQRY
ncbi:hypothetical protein LZ32DRAFT_228939 [Colletotrichum eremochloae]|nr:hypothetical protein LZ32DRAFT_228939 [Colletotrichum eremochloae]